MKRKSTDDGLCYLCLRRQAEAFGPYPIEEGLCRGCILGLGRGKQGVGIAIVLGLVVLALVVMSI